MTNLSHREMIPISALNALEYCPRKFYYQFVQGETQVNEFVLEGALAHQQIHQPDMRIVDDVVQITGLYLRSETLRLSGFADVIELRGGMLIPVEYKRGRQGQWLGDQVQLCAQALCLEERLADHLSEARRESGLSGLHTKDMRQPGKPPIAYGYIYYTGSQRRVQVPFTPQLRARTKATIAQALRVAALETPPSPLSGPMTARCPNCSLISHCLPEEVRLLQSQERKNGVL